MTQFCSVQWLSHIPLYMYATSSLFTHLLLDFRLLPCPSYCKQCCNEHWGPCVLLDCGFLQVYAQWWATPPCLAPTEVHTLHGGAHSCWQKACTQEVLSNSSRGQTTLGTPWKSPLIPHLPSCHPTSKSCAGF